MGVGQLLPEPRVVLPLRGELLVVRQCALEQVLAQGPDVDRLLLLQKRVLADVRQVIFDGLLGQVEVRLRFDPRDLFPAPGPLDDRRGADGDQRYADERSGCRHGPRLVLPEPARQFFHPALGVRRCRLVRQPVVEVLRQRANRGVSRLGCRRHRLQANRFQRRRDRAVHRSRRRKVAPDHLGEDLSDLLLVKRGLPGDQLVKTRPQAVDVAGGTKLIDQSARLFRAHISGGADCRPLLGSASPSGIVSDSSTSGGLKSPSAPVRSGSGLPITFASPQSTTRVSP